jgi:hypothetical protein
MPFRVQSTLSNSRLDRRYEELISVLIAHRNAVALFREVGPLGSNPVGDKAGVSPGLFS